MQSGFYAATGGMVTQFNRLDAISNNLANSNTAGFKRDDVVIGDFLRLYKEQRDDLPLRNHTKDAAKFLNRSMDRVPQIVEQYTDRSLGHMLRSGNDLDFAMQRENAYFAVETPEGVRYTRSGEFSLNNNGRLVTKEGFPVLPKEYFQESGYIDFSSDQKVTFDKDGNYYIDEVLAGSIGIFEFENQKYIKKEGGNLYKELREGEDRRILEGSGALVQGFIEKSNVNPVLEMSALIETNRLVDMYSKVMKSHMDDLNSDAITKLANIKA